MRLVTSVGRRARIFTKSSDVGLTVILGVVILLAVNAEFSGIRPFGTAIFAALLPTWAGAAFLVAGSIFCGLGGIGYILSACAFLAASYIKKLDTVASGIVISVLTAIFGMLVMMFSEIRIMGILLQLAESLATGVLFYIFSALRRTASVMKPTETRHRQLARLVILGAAAGGLGRIISLESFHMGIFAGLIMSMLICGGTGLCEAVTASMLIGILSSMGSVAQIAVMGLFAACAMLAAFLDGLGKWGIVLGYLCGGSLCILLAENYYTASVYLRPFFAAVCVYAILPEFICDAVGEKIRVLSKENSSFRERERLKRKISDIRLRHSQICDSLKRITQELEREEQLENSDAVYKISSAVAQRADGEGSVSGDCYMEFEALNGRYYFLLCDGRGAGKKAYKESRMTAELMSEFLKNGFLKDKAVSMINSALAIKGDEESFSTLDIMELDMHTGDCEFLKIGSAQSFIKHKDELETLSSVSLPVGIVDEIRISPVSRRLYVGDMVVMVSDGVGEAGYGVLKGEWIKRMIKSSGNDLETLAESILTEARRRSYPEKDDDMTVAVLRVERRKQQNL